MEIKLKSRPFSTLNKMTQFPSTKSINSYISKPLNISKPKEPKEKRFYLNLSHRNAYNPFSKVLKNKKLFYDKIYNRNLGNIDSLGLSKYIKIKRERIKSSIKSKDFSSTRISSTNTHRKINLRPKINQQTQENENNKSLEFSYEKDNIIYNLDSYYQYIKNKKDISNDININNDEYIQMYNKIKNISNISKKSHLSVSSLLKKKEKNIENNENIIDVKPIVIDSEKMTIKNIYIIKYGEISNLFNKIMPNNELIRPINKEKFISMSNNIHSKFVTYNKIVLEKTSDENCLKALYNFCEEVANWQKLVLDEVRYLKKENINLDKKQKFFEKELNIKLSEIKEVNENIIKYDLNKLKKGKLDETKSEKMKSNFINIESNYIITIYQLKKEINNLNKIIEKSKEENKTNEGLKDNIKKLMSELDKNKNWIFKNDLSQKHKDILVNLYIEDLNRKSEEHDKEKEQIKNNEFKLSEEIVNLKAKINSLNDAIKEKDIIISDLQNRFNKNIINSNNEDIIGPAKIKFIAETK